MITCRAETGHSGRILDPVTGSMLGTRSHLVTQFRPNDSITIRWPVRQWRVSLLYNTLLRFNGVYVRRWPRRVCSQRTKNPMHEKFLTIIPTYTNSLISPKKTHTHKKEVSKSPHTEAVVRSEKLVNIRSSGHWSQNQSGHLGQTRSVTSLPSRPGNSGQVSDWVTDVRVN